MRSACFSIKAACVVACAFSAPAHAQFFDWSGVPTSYKPEVGYMWANAFHVESGVITHQISAGVDFKKQTSFFNSPPRTHWQQINQQPSYPAIYQFLVLEEQWTIDDWRTRAILKAGELLQVPSTFDLQTTGDYQCGSRICHQYPSNPQPQVCYYGSAPGSGFQDLISMQSGPPFLDRDADPFHSYNYKAKGNFRCYTAVDSDRQRKADTYFQFQVELFIQRCPMSQPGGYYCSKPLQNNFTPQSNTSCASYSCAEGAEPAQCELAMQLSRLKCTLQSSYDTITQKRAQVFDCSVAPNCTPSTAPACQQIQQAHNHYCQVKQTLDLAAFASRLTKLAAQDTAVALDRQKVALDSIELPSEAIDVAAQNLHDAAASLVSSNGQPHPLFTQAPLTPSEAEHELAKIQPGENGTVLPSVAVNLSELMTPYVPADCQPDLQIPFSVLGLTQQFTLPLGQWCAPLALFGALLHLGTALTSIRIVLGA